MKNFLAVTASILFALNLCACSDKDDEDDDNDDASIKAEDYVGDTDNKKHSVDIKDDLVDSPEMNIDKISESEKIVKLYFDAIENQDAEKYMQIYHEEALESTKDAYEWTDEEQIEYYTETVSSTYVYLEEEYGKNVSVQCDIINEIAIEGDDLDVWNDIIEDSWDVFSLNVSEGYNLKVEVTIKTDAGKNVIDGEFVVLNVDEEWCIVSRSVEW